MHMLERIVVTKPFKTNTEAMGFFDALKAQMHKLGYIIEPAPSSGGIGRDIIGMNVDQPCTGENFGNVRIKIGSGQMIIEAAGNMFAWRNLTAVALGLGLPPYVALELAASAMDDETESGGRVLMAIVPNVEIAE